jgi:hypothetical protein
MKTLILFLKAVKTKAAHQGGLFDQQVTVTGHTTAHGTFVAPYQAKRKHALKPAPEAKTATPGIAPNGKPSKLTKAELSEFVASVKEAVTELRQQFAQKQSEFQEDIAGAHQAWHGTRPAPRSEPAVESPHFREQSETLAPKAKKKKR